MTRGKNVHMKDVIPIVLMGSLFVLIQGLSLFFVRLFERVEMEPVVEDAHNPINIVTILVILLFVTAVILLIAKYWKKQAIQVLILGAIGYTAFYTVFLPLFSYVLPQTFQDFAFIAAVVVAVLLVLALYKYPEWYVIDLCGIIIGAGAIAIFGYSLGILIVIILLAVLAVYDAISVYKTKHMIDLADTVLDLKLPVLLVIPKIRHYSLLKETKRLKEKLKDDEERDAFFIGLGDVVMPGILVAATYHNITRGFPITVSVMIGTLIGFLILMSFVIKGKPQAGLPLLCGGAIGGYLVSSLLFTGELMGLTLPF